MYPSFKGGEIKVTYHLTLSLLTRLIWSKSLQEKREREKQSILISNFYTEYLIGTSTER